MDERFRKIIDLPHHTSTKHPPMARSDRAAQFAPYSALSGYEDAVDETARPTENKIQLDESEIERLNATLVAILSSSEDTKVSITFFRKDKYKSGGEYVTVRGEIGEFDEINRTITLIGGAPINISDITKVGEIFDMT